jgi:hypothetical protein
VQRLPVERPGLYAKALRLALALASDPTTAEPVARLLLPGQPAEGLLPHLGALLRAPLPPLAPLPGGGGGPPGGVHAAVSALRQRAYVLRWYALTLFACRRRDLRAPLLATLFGGDASASTALALPGDAAAFAPGGGAGAAALAAVVGLSVAEPSIKDLPAEELRVAEDMVVADVSVRALLTGPQVRRRRRRRRGLPGAADMGGAAGPSLRPCCLPCIGSKPRSTRRTRHPPPATRHPPPSHPLRSLSSWGW